MKAEFAAMQASLLTSDINEEATIERKMYSLRNENISKTLDKAIDNKGKIDTEHNQQKITKVPPEVADMVLQASDGKIDISNKYFAIHGDYIWHEYRKHSDQNKETSEDQISLTRDDVKKAVQVFYDPDIVECIFEDTSNVTQRKSFAFAKKDKGYIMVVEVVGGKTNPNIIPVEIIHVTNNKWQNWIGKGKSIADMIFKSDAAKRDGVIDNQKNIKNRVIAARLEQNPPQVTPHSPRHEDSITDTEPVVNTQNKRFSLRYDETEFDARRELSTALMDVEQNEEERKSLENYQKMIKTLNERERIVADRKQKLETLDKAKDAKRYAELLKEIRQQETIFFKYNYYRSLNDTLFLWKIH